MALLRNRPVTILGPTTPEVSPIYTVQYPDGTREDAPLKFIQMSESEHKDWSKTNPRHADVVRTVPDNEVQEITDAQDVKKISEDQKKQKQDQFVPTQTYAKVADMDKQATVETQDKVVPASKTVAETKVSK